MDWGFALKVAGIGFGGVFLILVTLALVLWLTGIGIHKASKKDDKSGAEQGKEKHGPRGGGSTDTGQDT